VLALLLVYLPAWTVFYQVSSRNIINIFNVSIYFDFKLGQILGMTVEVIVAEHWDLDQTLDNDIHCLVKMLYCAAFFFANPTIILDDVFEVSN